MKCTLEFKAKKHESTEFTDRLVFTMVASINAGGMNVRSLFEKLLGAQTLEDSTLFKEAGMDSLFRDFDVKTADQNINYVIETVFPTLGLTANQLSTIDLINIVKPMILELANSQEAIAPVVEPPPPQVDVVTELKSSDDDLNYPPDRIDLLPMETHAIGYASRSVNHSFAKVDCWYQWWKAINEIPTDTELTPIDVVELIVDQAECFKLEETLRYHTLIQAYLLESPEVLEPTI